MPWVGSCDSQNTFSSSPNVTCFGSNTTRTASVCPVRPVQTSSYVGFGVYPPAYPTAVVQTPGMSQKNSSAPQKQPVPNHTSSYPSGAGAVCGVPSTMFSAGTANDRCGRPASAFSCSTICVLCLKKSIVLPLAGLLSSSPNTRRRANVPKPHYGALTSGDHRGPVREGAAAQRRIRQGDPSYPFGQVLGLGRVRQPDEAVQPAVGGEPRPRHQQYAVPLGESDQRGAHRRGQLAPQRQPAGRYPEPPVRQVLGDRLRERPAAFEQAGAALGEDLGTTRQQPGHDELLEHRRAEVERRAGVQDPRHQLLGAADPA